MTYEYPPQDDIIDLRKYIKLLLARKWWILGIAFLGALLAFGFASLLTRQYQATSIAAVTKSRNEIQFDPRIETVTDASLNYQSFAALALSDSIVEELYQSLETLPPEISNPLDLRERLSTEVNTDLILLTAQNGDPISAQTIANQWVEIFVRQANSIYNTMDSSQITFFEQQFQDAKGVLDQTNSAMVEFQSRNRETILSNQLNALQTSLGVYLDRQQSSEILLQDIRSLTEQMEALQPDQPAAQSLLFSVLLLQNRAYAERTPAIARSGTSSSVDSQDTTPVQIQVSAADPSAPSVNEQIQLMAALEDVVQTQLDSLATLISDLEPQIIAIQQELEATLAEKDSLKREQSVAQETYTTLARKVEETRIAAADTSGQVRLASYAIPDDDPVSPRRLLMTLVGGAAGFFFAVVAVLLLSWWREPVQTPVEEARLESNPS
jgi:uncharacterized protein involved in exopolysaccharide biosynthesis